MEGQWFFWIRRMVVECAVQCVRQWWFNLQWVQWFWINVVVVLVLQRDSGCGGCLSWSYRVLLLELR